MFSKFCSSKKKIFNLYDSIEYEKYKKSEAKLEIDLTDLTYNQNKQIIFNKYTSDNYVQNFLKRIVYELKYNPDSIYFNDYSIFKKLKRKKYKDNFNEINQILALHRLNRYPSDYIHCFLANHIYNFSELRCCEQSIGEQWEMYDLLRIKGYQSAIYINEMSQQVVVAYQGLKFKKETFSLKNWDLYENYIDSLFTDKGVIPNHLFAVYVHVSKAFYLSQKLNYTLSFTSYSFGSLLADLSLSILNRYFHFNGARSVNFESIGSLDLLFKLRSNKIDLIDLDVNTYLLKPLLLNSCKKHLGKIKLFKKTLNFEEFEFDSSSYYSDYKGNLNKKDLTYIKEDTFFNSSLNSLCSANLETVLTNLKDNSNVILDVEKWALLNYSSKDYPTLHTIFNSFAKKRKLFQYNFNLKISKKYSNSLRLVCSEFKRILYFTFKKLYYHLNGVFLKKNFGLCSIESIYYLRKCKGFNILLETPVQRISTYVFSQLDYENKAALYKTSEILTDLKNSIYIGENHYKLNYLASMIYMKANKMKKIIEKSLIKNQLKKKSESEQKVFKSVMIWLYEKNLDNACFAIKKMTKKFGVNLNKSETEIFETFANIINTYIEYFDFSIFIHENFIEKFKDIIRISRYSSEEMPNLNIFTMNNRWILFMNNDFIHSFSEKLNRLDSERTFDFYEIEYNRYQNQHINNFIKILIKRNFLETRDLNQINHLAKYYFEFFTFIELDNKKAFNLMFYLAFLDGNNINLKLLKNVSNLIDDFNCHDLENELFDYLIEISFLIKLNDEEYCFNEHYQDEFLQQINISYILKANIMNKIVSALVNLILLEDNLTLQDIEIFYKQSNVIKNIDWYLKEANLEYKQLIEMRDYIYKNYCFEMISFSDKFQKIESNNINELILETNKKELHDFVKYTKESELTLDDLKIDIESAINGIEEKIFDEFADMMNKIQQDKELMIQNLMILKEYKDKDESKLSELDNDSETEIDNLEDLSEILMIELKKDRNQAIERLNKIEKVEMIKQINSICEFMGYALKNYDKDSLFSISNSKNMFNDLVNEFRFRIQNMDHKSFVNLLIESTSEHSLYKIYAEENIDFLRYNLSNWSENDLKNFYIYNILILEDDRLLLYGQYKYKFGLVISSNCKIIMSTFIAIVEPVKYFLKIDEFKKICIVRGKYLNTIIYDYDLNEIKNINEVAIKGSSQSSYYGIDKYNNLNEFDLQFDRIQPNLNLDRIIRNTKYDEIFRIENKYSRFILNFMHSNIFSFEIHNENGSLISQFSLLDFFNQFECVFNFKQIVLKYVDKDKRAFLRHYSYNGRLIKEVKFRNLSELLKFRTLNKHILSPSGNVYFC